MYTTRVKTPHGSLSNCHPSNNLGDPLVTFAEVIQQSFGGKAAGEETLCSAIVSIDNCTLNRSKSGHKSSSKVPGNSSLSSTSICKHSQSLLMTKLRIWSSVMEFARVACVEHVWVVKDCFRCCQWVWWWLFCHHCSSKCMRDGAKALRERVSSLKAPLRLHSTTTTWSSSLRPRSTTTTF